MTIRATIWLACIPLFILLAVMNGALLLSQSRSALIAGLDQRALAAAVSGAEYLAAMPDAQQFLGAPLRRAALQRALGHVADLDRYDLVDHDGRAISLLPPERLNVNASLPSWKGEAAPSYAKILPLARDAAGRRVVTAVAPAGAHGFVAARFDAEPLFARTEELRRWMMWGVGLAAIIGLLAGAYVARRIGRELAVGRATMKALDGGNSVPRAEPLSIEEAASLADALWLIEGNRRRAQIGMEQDKAGEDMRRDDAMAFAQWRETLFPPIHTMVKGASLSVQIMADSPPGCFYALCEGEKGAALVIGQCGGDDAMEALAAALAARRFLERQGLALGLQAALRLGSQAFSIERSAYHGWNAGNEAFAIHQLCLTDDESCRQADLYAQADPQMMPDQWLGGISALIHARGVFGAVRRD